MERREAEDALVLRAEMLREVAESELDDARRLLLVDVIETYFELTEEERERFHRLVARKEYSKVQEVELTWAERLREEGRQEGREEGLQRGREIGRRAGLLEGKRDALLRLLTSRFGTLSEERRARLMEIASVAEIDALFDRATKASSIEHVGI